MKAILFDLDGVLIDTEQYHREALLRAARETLRDNVTEADLQATLKFDGRSTSQKLCDLYTLVRASPYYNRSDVEEEIDDLLWEIDLKKQQYTLPLLEQIQPVPAVTTMLEMLADEYWLGLVTNTRDANMSLILDRMGIRSHFDYCYSEARKPSSTAYLSVIRMFYASSDDVLIVEDSLSGRIAARDAGAYVYEVTDASDLKFEELQNGIREANNCRTNGRTGITVRRAGLRQY